MPSWCRRWRAVVPVLAAVVCLSACTGPIDGSGGLQNAPDATLSVKGSDPGSSFDVIAKNALTDIMSFWRTEFPKVSNGAALTALKGGFYSVDGLQVATTGTLPASARSNACAQKTTSFVIDNGAFCVLDDSISWDRAPTHLFAQLAARYGPFLVALIFAHEFGHAISYRLGVFDQALPTIDTESQADCAAGAWAASALRNQDPHFLDVTPATLEDALEGYLDSRDSTPDTPQDVSHGNGFDRLSAVADGIDKGAGYCFSSGYFASRRFTERPFTSASDFDTGGNAPLSDVLAANADNDFVQDLNRFWGAAAKQAGKTFTPVRIAAANHPTCASGGPSEFGYCPSDNTVYYDPTYARSVYYSLPDVSVAKTTGNVTLVSNQPADFALGTLFAIGWGLAARHQLAGGSLDDGDGLLAGICYTGAYAKDVNVEASQQGARLIVLSPADLDEATSAILGPVADEHSYGARGTTGLDRIQAFVKGYAGGVSAC